MYGKPERFLDCVKIVMEEFRTFNFEGIPISQQTHLWGRLAELYLLTVNCIQESQEDFEKLIPAFNLQLRDIVSDLYFKVQNDRRISLELYYQELLTELITEYLKSTDCKFALQERFDEIQEIHEKILQL